VFPTDEAEQLFDRKLQRAMDGLGDMMERMMERTMDMMERMERERREDLERMERNRREDHERLMERLPQMFVEALAVHGAGSVPPSTKRTPAPPAESRIARTPAGEPLLRPLVLPQLRESRTPIRERDAKDDRRTPHSSS
jgi:hypothetical protein